MVFDLNNMAIFSRVAELEGISSAARALQIPKSKVSRRMVKLEEQLGVRLLERTTRSVRLTEAGEIYYQHCRRIVDEASNARESINQMLESPRGRLRVSASIAVGQYLIGPHVANFLATYPDVKLEIELDNRHVNIVAQGFDVAIRLGQLEDSTLVSKRLGTGFATLVAAPDYLEAAGVPEHPGDLVGHRLVAMGATPSFGHWDINGPDGMPASVDTTGATVLNDLSMIRQLVEDGGGVSSLPDYITHAAIESGRLVKVLPKWQSRPFQINGVYPSRSSMTLKLRAWMEFFSDRLEQTIGDQFQ